MKNPLICFEAIVSSLTIPIPKTSDAILKNYFRFIPHFSSLPIPFARKRDFPQRRGHKLKLWEHCKRNILKVQEGLCVTDVNKFVAKTFCQKASRGRGEKKSILLH